MFTGFSAVLDIMVSTVPPSTLSSLSLADHTDQVVLDMQAAPLERWRDTTRTGFDGLIPEAKNEHGTALTRSMVKPSCPYTRSVRLTPTLILANETVRQSSFISSVNTRRKSDLSNLGTHAAACRRYLARKLANFASCSKSPFRNCSRRFQVGTSFLSTILSSLTAMSSCPCSLRMYAARRKAIARLRDALTRISSKSASDKKG